MFGAFAFGQPFFGQVFLPSGEAPPPPTVGGIALTGEFLAQLDLTGAYQTFISLTGSSRPTVTLTGEFDDGD